MVNPVEFVQVLVVLFFQIPFFLNLQRIFDEDPVALVKKDFGPGGVSFFLSQSLTIDGFFLKRIDDQFSILIIADDSQITAFDSISFDCNRSIDGISSGIFLFLHRIEIHTIISNDADFRRVHAGFESKLRVQDVPEMKL